MGRLPPTYYEVPQGYQVHLFGTDELGNNIDILGTVPEKIQWDLSSTWAPLIESGSPVGVLSFINHPIVSYLEKINNTSLNLTGYSGLNPNLTMELWRTSTPISLPIIFQLNAISDAYSEVMLPCKQLNKLQLPSVSNGIMKSPGPSFLDINNKYQLFLHVGPLVFSNVTVKAVSTDYDGMIDRNSGNFISAECHVTFSTSTMATKADMDSIFGGTETISQTPLESLASQFTSVLNSVKG